MSQCKQQQLVNDKPKDTLARARYQERSKESADEVVKGKRDVRLPWIHKRGDNFHSSNIPPWKNQVDVPLWWTLRAIFWFIDGSEGGSHFWSFSRNSFPVTISKPRGPTSPRSDDERFSSSSLLAFASFPPIRFVFRNANDGTRNAYYAPFVSAVTLSSTLCVTFRTSAIAIRASS